MARIFAEQQEPYERRSLDEMRKMYEEGGCQVYGTFEEWLEWRIECGEFREAPEEFYRFTDTGAEVSEVTLKRLFKVVQWRGELTACYSFSEYLVDLLSEGVLEIVW